MIRERDADASGVTEIRAAGINSFIAARAWLILGCVWGVVVWGSGDGEGALFGLGLGALLGCLDVICTYIYLGRRRILLSARRARVMWGPFTLHSIEAPSVRMVVVEPNGGWLSVFLPAYRPFATVEMWRPGDRVRFDFMVSSARDTRDLQEVVEVRLTTPS